MKRIAFLAAIITGLSLLGSQTALAADPGCTALGGDDTTVPGVCQVSAPVSVSGVIGVNEPLHILAGGVITVNNAVGLTLNIGPANSGNGLVMEAGSMIDGGDYGCGGGNIKGFPVTINANGNIDIQTGATIRSDGCSGGAIAITTVDPYSINIDGLVSSAGAIGGVPNQPPGGGPITIIAGCELTVSDTGVISSRGQDPGADLVHLQGCTVTIHGLVESNGVGHSIPVDPPNHCNADFVAHPHFGTFNVANSAYTACVEIWGNTVTIDATGTHNGEVNAGGIKTDNSPPRRGWIDIFALKDITIIAAVDNNAAHNPDEYVVHAEANGATNQFGGLITIKSKAGKVDIKAPGANDFGLALNANAPGAGGVGGDIVVQAGGTAPNGAVSFAADSIQAKGAAGGTGEGGGRISAVSFLDNVLGHAPGELNADSGGTPGSVTLEACLTVTYTGTITPGPGTIISHGGVGCPVGPTFTTVNWYNAQSVNTFLANAALCLPPPCLGCTKSGTKFNDVDGNHVRDVGEPGLPNWTISLWDATQTSLINVPPGLVNPATTDANGNYSFSGLQPGNYVVCETPQATWNQTFPQVGDPGTVACNNGTVGYAVTLAFVGGVCEDTGNDFGNNKPGKKSGMKFKDLPTVGVKDATDPGLPNWPINLLTTGNVGLQSTLTAADGTYSFTIAAPGTYRVCEGPVPAIYTGYTQSFPVFGVTPPPNAGESVINTCPNPNTAGYEFTIAAGDDLKNNDFGNKPPSETVTCPEDANRAPLLTRTVDTSKAAPGAGTGDAGSPINYLTVQAAYDAAKVSPNTKDEVIGLFSKTVENVVLDDYTAKSMTLTQCTSAEVKAANNGLPVWSLTANKKLLIISPDSVGGTVGWLVQTGSHDLKSIRADYATGAGIHVVGSNNSISWNDADNNGIGVDVYGDSNVLKGGSVRFNQSYGVRFNAGADNNTLSGATIESNGASLGLGGHGVLVAGGSGNKITSNAANKNSGDGFNHNGTNTNFSGNKSNNGSAGSSTENAGAEYRFVTTAINGGSNRADGVNVPSAAKGCTSFNAGQVCE